ncbi:MAG: TetR/AcrR family transcriptional regulator [Verrucomicrobiota bacterium]
MNMSIPYERVGRTHQKARTRGALIDAARRLLAEGVTPTVEQAADAAQVSRTTAYRYFRNQRALIVATFPEVTAGSLLPDPAPEDPADRLEAVTEALTNQILEHEPELRAQLRLSLEDGGVQRRELPFRTGKAVVWIEEALAPLRERVPEAEFHRLALAIRTAVGIEALVWLTDIAGLSREEAADLMRWSARALFDAAVADQDAAEASGYASLDAGT